MGLDIKVDEPNLKIFALFPFLILGVIPQLSTQLSTVSQVDISQELFSGRAAFIFNKVKQVNRTIFSDKYLFVTNLVISASLSGVGDAIEQKTLVLKDDTKKQEEFDFVRSRNMCISGVILGVFGHKWYQWLDGRHPGRTASVITYKVLMDSLVFSPTQIILFFSVMGFLERSSPIKVGEEIVEKGKVLYLFEWMIWAPVQVFNFYFLAPKYRILFDNSLSLIYDVFVSYVKYDLLTEDSSTSIGADDN